MNHSWHAKRLRQTVIVGIVLLLTAIPLVVAPISAATLQGAPPSVTVQLNEVDDSNVSGTVTLTAQGGQTNVDMRLTGAGVQGDHPTHIHTGTCENFDPNPLYPLETVILQPVDNTGRSVSTVDVPLEQLQSGEYVILVHLSRDALTTYLVCGEIPQTGAAAPAGGTVAAVPDAGSGAGEGNARPAIAALVFSLLAGAAGVGALVVRRHMRARFTR